MRYEIVHLHIDDEAIARDPWAVVEPVWWAANIYDGPDEYEFSLRSFSRPQRHVFAIQWYRSEVNNGGHRQFFSNSTGIVWKDALEAFRAVEATEFAVILERAAERLGGSPSLDRQERSQQMNEFEPEFRDLDDDFFKAQSTSDLDGKICNYIQSRPQHFHFDGPIRRAVLPGR